VSTPRLREPFARRTHPAETAEFTLDGWHCDVRRCREPVSVYAWYYPRRGGRPTGAERFLCTPHGEAFARRQHLEIEPAPAEGELGFLARTQPPGAWAFLVRLDAEAIAGPRLALRCSPLPRGGPVLLVAPVHDGKRQAPAGGPVPVRPARGAVRRASWHRPRLRACRGRGFQ
jgi:hypothetical protein